jgi:hypothetical protein
MLLATRWSHQAGKRQRRQPGAEPGSPISLLEVLQHA